MSETVDTPFLPEDIRIKAEKYVWKHYPLSESSPVVTDWPNKPLDAEENVK